MYCTPRSWLNNGGEQSGLADDVRGACACALELLTGQTTLYLLGWVVDAAHCDRDPDLTAVIQTRGMKDNLVTRAIVAEDMGKISYADVSQSLTPSSAVILPDLACFVTLTHSDAAGQVFAPYPS